MKKLVPVSLRAVARAVALTSASLLLVSWNGSCVSAQYTGLPGGAPPAQLPGDQAAPQYVAQQASRWPMIFELPQGQVTVYQPQLTKFDGDKIAGRAAVSVLKPGAQNPVFGAVWMESRVSIDRAARTVQIVDVNVTQVKFPDADEVTAQTLTSALQGALPGQTMRMTLDQLLAQVQVIEKEKQAVAEINNEAPKIVFEAHPTVLVPFDGTPRLDQMPNSPLLRADNTPFFVALDPGSRTYFLKGGGRWFAGPDALGPYRYVQQVPPNVAQLADDSGYKDPQNALSDAQAAGVEIVTATEPTELIWTDGPEQMSPIGGTDLLYVSNTDSDVFLQIDTQTIFVLISGRWYASPSKLGPWTYVKPDALPPDFKLIPPNSEKGDVLAQVAGTQQARDAVANSFIPQTAAIDRSNFDQPTIQYDGDPQFQPIENTTMQYCVNTPGSVLLVDGQYYCCSNAVWYVSGNPRDHWQLCMSVPQVIYTIPPSCPVYSCRWVYVYGFTDQVVYCGYLPGYVGCLPYDGVVVYGTGYHYRPWIGHDYYPRPFTYGFAAHYDGYSGHWGYHVGFDSGDATGWFGERTGPVARRGGWFGHGGYRPAYDYRDYTQAHSSVPMARPDVHQDELNLYQRRKDYRPVVVANDHRPEEHPAVAVPRNEDARNDVLTDPQGKVYRRTVDGWEERQGDKWVANNPSPANQPRPAEGPKVGPGPENPRPNVHEEPKPVEAPKVEEKHEGPKAPVEAPKVEAPRENPKPEVKEEPKPVEAPKVEEKHEEPKAPVEAPKVEAPRENPKPDVKEEPKHEAPAPKEEPKQNAPKAETPKDNGNLNNDYKARVQGDERQKNYPTAPPPAPPQNNQGGGNNNQPGQSGGGGKNKGH